MKNVACIFWLLIVMSGRVLSESLDDWILSKILADEQILIHSINRTNGHDLQLLRHSKYYNLIFLEQPENTEFISAGERTLFENWMKEVGDADFLPGGYIWRIRFEMTPSLYAMSAGFWEGNWHSLDLRKDLRVDSFNVWNGAESDELLVTVIAGAPPRLLVYDRHGEIKKEEVFDTHAANLEEQVLAAEQPYKQKGAAILEMLSLAEYLENPDASWREADLSGRFHFGNQQQRDTERERLKPYFHLTRKTAIEALQSKSSPQKPRRPRASSDAVPVPQAPEPMKSPEAGPTPAGESPVSTRWPVVAVVIIAALGMLWVLLKKRK
jgi:hypothetical protein